jgi:hypothetical protein
MDVRKQNSILVIRNNKKHKYCKCKHVDITIYPLNIILKVGSKIRWLLSNVTLKWDVRLQQWTLVVHHFRHLKAFCFVFCNCLLMSFFSVEKKTFFCFTSGTFFLDLHISPPSVFPSPPVLIIFIRRSKL